MSEKVLTKEAIQKFEDPFEKDLVFSARYKVGREEYYEYLKAQDIREIPMRKKAALRNFIIQIVAVLAAALLVALSRDFQAPMIYAALALAAAGVILMFLQNYVFYKGNVKFIEKLRKTAEKKGKDVQVHVRLEIYKEEIYVDNGPVRYYVRPMDVDAWFETEHLLAINIRKLKNTPCKDLDRIIIPKTLAGDKLQEIEDTLSTMIRIGDRVLAKMGK